MSRRRHRPYPGVLASFSAALLAGATVSCDASAPAPDIDAPSVIALETAMWEDWKQGRYDAMGRRMTTDVLIADDVSGMLDRAGLMAFMKGSGCTPESYEIGKPAVRTLAPGVAVVAYEVTTVGMCGGQRTTSAPQVATSVWVRRDTTWLTAVHHQNSVTRPGSVGGGPAPR